MDSRRVGARDRILLAVFVALAVVLAHGNSWSSPFHFDDFHSIVDNAWLRSLRHIPGYFTDVAVFSPLVENRAYRPFLLIGFAVSHALGGGAPWGYHLIALILHVVGATVVGLLARRVLAASGVEPAVARALAFLGALVFAVHPLVTEPVSYVSSRSSLQAAVFAWASVLAYVVAREDRRPRLFWVSLALLVLALGTKIIAVTVPALLVLWELTLGPARREPKAWIARVAPFAVTALVLTAAHEWVVGDAARDGRSTVPPLHYLLTETEVWLHFLGLFVWPEDLSADLTMEWRTIWWSGPVARAILANLALVALAIAARSRWPAVTFGVLAYYVTLSPTNSIVPLSEPASEHRVYVALTGVVLAVLGLLAPVVATATVRARRVIGALAVAWIAALGVVAHARNQVWQSDLTLWRDVVERSPDNGRAHLNYGLAQLSRGDRAGARASFERCAQAWPQYSFCYINKAVLALDERRQADADREIATAERLMPSNVYVRLWRGHVDRAAERWADAERAYLTTLALAPGHLDARRGLAFARFMQSRVDEARPELDALAAEGALDADGEYALGFLADVAQDLERAIRHYRSALAKKDGHSRATYNLAVALQRRGELVEAIRLYDTLVARGEAAPDALFNLAVALWQSGQADRARAVREVLRAAAPNHAGLTALTW